MAGFMQESLAFELRKKIEHGQKSCPVLKVDRIEIAIPSIDILAWLSAQDTDVRFHWEDRHENSVSGVGSLLAIKHPLDGYLDGYTVHAYHKNHPYKNIHLLLSHCHANVRFFGGRQFEPLVETMVAPCKKASMHWESWEDFSSYHYIIPTFEVLKNAITNNYTLAFNFFGQDIRSNTPTLFKKIGTIKPAQAKKSQFFPQMVSNKMTINPVEWSQKIEHVLAMIAANDMQKMVLTNSKILAFSENLDAMGLLIQLRKIKEKSHLFYVQFKNETAFLGVSPECLYERKGRHISCEAVAGTCLRSPCAEKDAYLGKCLFSSPKDIQEHAMVDNWVHQRLLTLCQSHLTMSPTTLLKLHHVQHIYRTYSGTLRPHITDHDIHETLHPTPAICGVPQKKASASIQKLEPYPRGWYSGTVGFISQQHTQLAVAIRSALLKKNILRLFAGSGIVRGSSPTSEWEEIQLKMENFYTIIRPTPISSSSQKR